MFHRRLNEDHENIVVPSGHKIHSLAVSSFEVRIIINKRAATCDFHQCGILTGEDSDEHLQPPFKLRDSK